jgi:hypothetical protein
VKVIPAPVGVSWNASPGWVGSRLSRINLVAVAFGLNMSSPGYPERPEAQRHGHDDDPVDQPGPEPELSAPIHDNFLDNFFS